MTRYSKYNIIYRLQKWLDSVPGQTFLNYAYSWGASIVILGTLFKLTHLPYANLMLYIGMGTEVFVFFISAFDRPFDKTGDGRDLPTHVEDFDEEGDAESGVQQTPDYPPIEIGNVSLPEVAAAASVPAQETGTAVVVPSLSADVAEATGSYIEQLQKLTEVLSKVSEQSQRLTTDSEEMENLNRTLTGISRVYELQLKSASQQIGTIDEINEQTKLLVNQMKELNDIYTRMIGAMNTRQ
ncbi:MAG: gliding motility protein GldL [Bacteroidaceae bacterium]|nr:gliding motility protein GldL [Bacteroidaceae bacterium]